MKNLKNKSFEQILEELDKMIKEDFIKFKKELKELSIREKVDSIFENSENSSTLLNDERFYNNAED